MSERWIKVRDDFTTDILKAFDAAPPTSKRPPVSWCVTHDKPDEVCAVAYLDPRKRPCRVVTGIVILPDETSSA